MRSGCSGERAPNSAQSGRGARRGAARDGVDDRQRLRAHDTPPALTHTLQIKLAAAILLVD